MKPHLGGEVEERMPILIGNSSINAFDVLDLIIIDLHSCKGDEIVAFDVVLVQNHTFSVKRVGTSVDAHGVQMLGSYPRQHIEQVEIPMVSHSDEELLAELKSFRKDGFDNLNIPLDGIEVIPHDVESVTLERGVLRQVSGEVHELGA